MEKRIGISLDFFLSFVVFGACYLMDWSLWGANSQLATSMFLAVVFFLFLRLLLFPLILTGRATQSRLLAKQQKLLSTLQQKEQSVEIEVELYEQLINISSFLEKWESLAEYCKKILPLIQKLKIDVPPELRENLSDYFENKVFFVEQKLCTALLSLERNEEAFERLEEIRNNKLFTNPEVLIELDSFYVGVVAQQNPQKAKEVFEQILLKATSPENKIQMLHALAYQWMELGQPQDAVLLLQKAVALAKNQKDDHSFLTTIYALCHAHGKAGNIDIAVELFVRLKKSYIYQNFPPVELLDHLQAFLHQRFEAPQLRNAILNAEKKLHSLHSTTV